MTGPERGDEEVSNHWSNNHEVSNWVSRFLFKYHIKTIKLHRTKGAAQAEMLSRKLRSHDRLDLLHPDVRQRVQNKHGKQKELNDHHRYMKSLIQSQPATRPRPTSGCHAGAAPAARHPTSRERVFFIFYTFRKCSYIPRCR